MGGAVRTGPVMRRVWKDGRPKSLGWVSVCRSIFTFVFSVAIVKASLFIHT